MSQLAQRLGFDLTDAFAGYIEDLTNLLKSFHPPIIKAVTQTQHVALPWAQRGQDSLKIFSQQILGNVLFWILNVGFDEIAEA